jgi:hypothetical protein
MNPDVAHFPRQLTPACRLRHRRAGTTTASTAKSAYAVSTSMASSSRSDCCPPDPASKTWFGAVRNHEQVVLALDAKRQRDGARLNGALSGLQAPVVQEATQPERRRRRRSPRSATGKRNPARRPVSSDADPDWSQSRSPAPAPDTRVAARQARRPRKPASRRVPKAIVDAETVMLSPSSKRSCTSLRGIGGDDNPVVAIGDARQA